MRTCDETEAHRVGVDAASTAALRRRHRHTLDFRGRLDEEKKHQDELHDEEDRVGPQKFLRATVHDVDAQLQQHLDETNDDDLQERTDVRLDENRGMR